MYYGYTTSSSGSYSYQNISNLTSNNSNVRINDSYNTSAYAPTTKGSSGQILRSTGSTPEWVDPKEVVGDGSDLGITIEEYNKLMDTDLSDSDVTFSFKGDESHLIFEETEKAFH